MLNLFRIVVGQQPRMAQQKRNYLIANANGLPALGTIANVMIRKKLVDQLVVASVSFIIEIVIFIFKFRLSFLSIIISKKKNPDCQNRFSTSMDKEEPSKSNRIQFSVTQSNGTNSNATNSNGARAGHNLFERDAYESFAQSLFSAAKTCHQNQSDVNTTHRTLLETFHAGLSRINQDLENKSRQK